MVTFFTSLISFAHAWTGGFYITFGLLSGLIALHSESKDDDIRGDAQSHHKHAIKYFDGIVLSSRAAGLAEVATAKQSFLQERIATKVLLLDSTQITDAGLAHLAGLKRLEELDLSGTRIDGAGLGYLHGLMHLKTLGLKNTQLGGAAFDNLAQIAHLTSLGLGGSSITDGEIGFVQNMKQLKILSLRQTRISDAGLAELVALENLQYLCLLETQVALEGIARLRRSLPRLRADH